MLRTGLLALLVFLAAACTVGTSPSHTADTAPAAGMPDGSPPGSEAEELVAGLALPATFTGTLPCADCEGIRWHLDLWPDGVFHLRRDWIGTNGKDYDRGRWRKDPARDAIVLHGGREIPIQFAVEGPRTLRKLDVEGRPIASDLPYELTTDGTIDPTDLRLTLHGMFTYLADAPRFEECLTGRSYPVAMEGAYIELERAYLAADKPAPGAPILATFAGRITGRPAMEGDHTIPTAVVERFIGLFPEQHCDRAMSQANLTGTYWRLVKLGAEPVPAVQDRREPHIILRGTEKRYSATVGCNQLTGGYSVEGERIDFKVGASTMMACPPPLAAREKALARVLAEARRWEISAQVLEFFDEDGESLATLEAVYLP